MCLDCRDAPPYCDTCTRARVIAGVRERHIKDRDAHNAYHRAYRKQMMTHPIQGPRVREQARLRMKRYRERKRDK